MKHSDVVKVLEKTTQELLKGNIELNKINDDCYEIRIPKENPIFCEISADEVNENSTSNIRVRVPIGYIYDLEACPNLLGDHSLRNGYSNYFFSIGKIDDDIVLFLETDVFIWPEFNIELAASSFFCAAIAPLLFFYMEKSRKNWPQGVKLF